VKTFPSQKENRKGKSLGRYNAVSLTCKCWLNRAWKQKNIYSFFKVIWARIFLSTDKIDW